MISAQVADILLENDLYLYKVDIVINQDVTSNSFGEIESLNITAGYVEDKGIPVQKINIERIAISGKIEDSEDDINIMQSLPSPAEIQIKNRLSDFYNMKQDNINISIQGG
jgi:stage III sporulation protein AF